MYYLNVVMFGTILLASSQVGAISEQEQDTQIKRVADLGDQIALHMDNCVISKTIDSPSCKRMVALDRQVADIRKNSLNNLTTKQSAALMERNPLVFQRMFRNHRIMCEKHSHYLPSNACN